ncbi:hypothetical protein M1E17_09800 [Arthrobacter sp. D1-29]
MLSNNYSVDPSFIGRIVDVVADLDTVWVTHEGVIIATHFPAWTWHLVVTNPIHVARAAVMRRDFRTQRVHCPELRKAVQVRDLAAYDEIFGIDLGPAAETGPRGGVMTGTPSQIEYYARALRAPRISDGFRRLGEQARDAGWSHEEYPAAVLSREVSERDASGAATRINRHPHSSPSTQPSVRPRVPGSWLWKTHWKSSSHPPGRIRPKRPPETGQEH